jgi:hypothetical protein
MRRAYLRLGWWSTPGTDARVRHMSLIGLLVALILVGVALYLVNTVIPMDPKIKTILNVVVVIVVLLWLLNAFFGGVDLGRPMRFR